MQKYIVTDVRVDKNYSTVQKVISWKSEKGEGTFIDKKWLRIPEILEFGEVFDVNRFNNLVKKHNINLF